MHSALKLTTRIGEFVAATMMAAMFSIFILQVLVRYTAREEWIAEAIPIIDPNLYGWTLELCLVLWIWLVFWGNSIIVRERDHVIFDLIYVNVNPKIRKWMAILSCLSISIGFLWALEPTWAKFYILRLKRTATLSNVFGDWIRVRDIYSIYFMFLFVVAARYAWRAWYILKNGTEREQVSYEDLLNEKSEQLTK